MDTSPSTLCRSLARRLSSRRGQAGVTLVEVMIVVVILGLISAGVAVGVLPKMKEAAIKTTRTSATELRRAAETYRGTKGGDKCPTPQLLVQEKELDTASKISDAWDVPFKIVCEDDETTVVSFGPDKKEGTVDDIRVPEAAKQQ